jgi:hypothetical protein
MDTNVSKDLIEVLISIREQKDMITADLQVSA